jgi:hypothetical protein
VSAKYTLSARAPFSAGWRKSTHDTLAAAVGAAWRKYNREWSIDGISHGQKVVIDSQGLMQAFARMDEIMRETPKLSLDEVSEQVIRGIEKNVSE